MAQCHGVRGRLFFFASPAAAQVFRLGEWEGFIEADAEMRHEDDETAGHRTSYDERHAEERLTLRNIGSSVFDPGLVTFSLGGTFGLTQDWWRAPGQRVDGSGTLEGYDTTLTLLGRHPVSATLFANRTEFSSSHELAGRSDITAENRGVTLSATGLYIPSTLGVRHETYDEESAVGDNVVPRRERRDILRYEGRRGWVDSDVHLLYELIDQTDVIFPTLSYRSHEGQLNYGLDFGKELNWHWDSRLRYLSRSGFLESTQWSVDEALRIEHSPSLRSDYRYLLLQSNTPTLDSTTHTGSATLEHRLYENLTTAVGSDVIFQRMSIGNTASYRGRLDFTYTKSLPFGGRLTAGLGGSEQYEDDRFTTSEGSVTQESQTVATPVALPISLANAFVVTGSIVVTKVGTGPVPLGCLPAPALPALLTAGVDFDVRAAGQFTEIVPRVCTAATVGINPGDTIAVDYRFTVAPARTFTTSAWHTNLAIDYRWIRVFASHEETEQTLLSGRDGQFLNDLRSDSIGAELRYEGSRLRASVLGEARRVTSTRLTYDTLRVSGLATLALFADLSLTATAEDVVTRYPRDDRDTTTTVARLGLSYFGPRGVSVEASAGYRRFEDSAQPTEVITDARLAARWVFRKLEITPTAEVFDRDRGDSRSREYRFLLRTIRRF